MFFITQASNKPGSVEDSHLSRPIITNWLERATFHHPAVLQDGLLLHQAGFTASLRFRKMRGVLLPHFSPLPHSRRLPLKRRNIVSVALSLFSRTVGVTHCLFYGARTFLPDSKMNQSDYLTYLGYFKYNPIWIECQPHRKIQRNFGFIFLVYSLSELAKILLWGQED